MTGSDADASLRDTRTCCSLFEHAKELIDPALDTLGIETSPAGQEGNGEEREDVNDKG